MKNLNWKGKILLKIIVSLILIIVITLPCITGLYSWDEWIKSILISGLIGITTSFIVSLIFMVQTDKYDYINSLEKEINELFEWCFKTHNQIYEILFDNTKNPKSKEIALTGIFNIKPNIHLIKSEYREFGIMFSDKFKKIKDAATFPIEEKALFDISCWYQDIANELLKVQDKFYQEYKGEPKKEIKDYLVFKEKN